METARAGKTKRCYYCGCLKQKLPQAYLRKYPSNNPYIMYHRPQCKAELAKYPNIEHVTSYAEGFEV